MDSKEIKHTFCEDAYIYLKKYIHKADVVDAFVFFIEYLLIHMFFFTHNLWNNDDGIFSSGGAGITSGRWLNLAANRLSSTWKLTWVVALICAFLLSITILFLYKTFNINSWLKYIVSVGVLSFPCLAAQNLFVYTVDSYMIAFLLVVIGVFINSRYKYGWLVSGILFTCSLGIYQAYFSLVLPMFLLKLIFDVLDGSDFRDAIKYVIRSILAIAIGLLGYKCVLEILLKVKQQELSSYMGISQMWDVTLKSLFARAISAEIRFFEVFLGDSIGLYADDRIMYVNAIMLIVIVLALLFIVWIKKVYKQVWKVCLLIAGSILMPMLIASIYVMSEYVHQLMVIGFILPVVILAASLERIKFNDEKKLRVLGYALGIISLAVILCYDYENVIATNKGYLKAENTHSMVYAFENRLIMRIEETEGYNSEVPIAFIGALEDEQIPGRYCRMTFKDTRIAQDSFCAIHYIASLREFAYLYLGMELKEPTDEVVEALKKDKRVAEMPLYPSKGSIANIDGAVVVKFSEITGEE